MTTTVYLVSKGDYSSYSIYGIFSTEEKAEQYARIIKGSVEPHEVDHPSLVGLPRDQVPYRVFVPIDGPTSVSRIEWLPNEGVHYSEGFRSVVSNVFDPPPGFSTEVWARDEEHAAKIGQDRVAKYRAEREGIA